MTMTATRLVTIAFSVVWLLSGAGKLATPRATRDFLTRVTARPVGTRAVRGLALVEVAIAVALVVPVLRTAAAVASAVGAVVLLAVLVRARTVPHLPCGCFGPLVRDRGVGAGHFMLVAAMLAAGLWLLAAQPDTRYLGLYAQALAVGMAMVLVGARYVRLRRIAYDESARDRTPIGQED